MKTVKQVLKDNPEHRRLIKAVLDGIDIDNIEDINQYGMSAGFGKFIYYSDTVAFFKKYKKDIVKLAENTADSLGEDVVSMVRGFNCLSSGSGKNRKPDYSVSEISRTLYGRSDETEIQNALAWFAAEEVCRMFED